MGNNMDNSDRQISGHGQVNTDIPHWTKNMVLDNKQQRDTAWIEDRRKLQTTQTVGT